MEGKHGEKILEEEERKGEVQQKRLKRTFLSNREDPFSRNTYNNNNTQIAAIAVPPSTTHLQLWAELLTFKPKCTIA